ncbi:MAG: dephospho-CoA kinase [Bacteroidetes bacterium]|nr:dephospho-CoA kinase [Bacteroidota bacterium]MCY4205617.1 dephospho-CoA kinase [Bacteroidota bacterium]
MLEIRTLGVTGGIGSGKTTVCGYLRELGAVIFEADLIARELMESSIHVREEIIQAFGGMSYRSNGFLNRPWLAGQVFGDESKLQRLNAIVHPRVGEAFEALKSRIQSGLLVHEAALIFEAKLEDHLDAVCLLRAPDDVRIERVKARDGVSDQQVRERMQSQIPPNEAERRADVILINEGDLTELRHKTQKLHELITGTESLSPETFRSTRHL